MTKPADPSQRLPLIAFRVGEASVELAPAPRWRAWMEETQDRFANRCLPLLVANEAGWVLLNPVAFRATWNGGDDVSDLTIEHADEGAAPGAAKSNFGYGIVTWELPYLFRTPPGYNLLGRGPANLPKDGAAPLEGLIETDWAVATFTMNWKLTRPDHPVAFEEDEPFCMIVPQLRGELEAFAPEVREVASDPETQAGYERFRARRRLLVAAKHYAASKGRADYPRQAWEPEYFRGRGPEESEAAVHQTKLRLSPFADGAPAEGEPQEGPGSPGSGPSRS